MFGRNDYINFDTEGGDDINADPVLDNDEQQQEPQPGVRWTAMLWLESVQFF